MKLFALADKKNCDRNGLQFLQVQDILWAIDDMESGYADQKEFDVYMAKLAKIYAV